MGSRKGDKSNKRIRNIGLIPFSLMSQRDGKETYATRYFISSLAMDVKRIAHAVRRHWSIENTCHWCLDITYREDESRIREARLRENFAWLNRFSLSLLKQHTEGKASPCNAAAAAGTSTRSSMSSTHKGLSVCWPWSQPAPSNPNRKPRRPPQSSPPTSPPPTTRGVEDSEATQRKFRGRPPEITM